MDHQVVVTFHYQQQEVFVKIVKFYSRHIPRQLQRLIEFVVLCAAISSLCLLLYAHAVVKHLPKRCVDASVAQRSTLLSEVDILRVDLAHDASLDYSLNDSYAKEFSLFGFYNALFDSDANEGDSEGESDEDEEDDAEDTAAGGSEDDFDVFVQDRNTEEADTAQNSSESVQGESSQTESDRVEHKSAKMHNGGKRRTRAERSAASSSSATTHFDERHPTDSLFANLCSSLYLMVTGGLARTTSTWPRHRTAKKTTQSSKTSRELHASANFIRQLARHFPPAAFAVVGGDALFASANNDRFVMEFSRELGFLKLSADVRSRLRLRTALWYFVAPQPVHNDNDVPSPSVSTPTPKLMMVSKATLNTESQANASNMRCEADRSERATPLSSAKTGFARRADDDIVRFDSGVCFGNQFDRFLFDYAFGYDDYMIGIVKRYAELLNVSHGFVRNVMNGEYYRYRTGGMARGGLRGASRIETVLRCALAMCGFTWLVSTLLRHSHEQIFALIVALLRHLETNWTLVLPASPLFVIVLGLLGAQVLLATVFRTDSPTAFFLLVAVWFADHFYALVSTGPGPHARTARVYFARFFYAYQLAFYVHYALESGLFAGLALVTYALFLLHAAIYLFHHHHLPLARAARARARRLRRSERHRQPTPESNLNANSNAEAEVEPEPEAEPGVDVQNDGPSFSADVQVPSESRERPAADAGNPLD